MSGVVGWVLGEQQVIDPLGDIAAPAGERAKKIRPIPHWGIGVVPMRPGSQGSHIVEQGRRLSFG